MRRLHGRKDWKRITWRAEESGTVTLYAEIGFRRKIKPFGTNLWCMNNSIPFPECLITRKYWNSARRGARWARST